jgi:hypothetical protein
MNMWSQHLAGYKSASTFLLKFRTGCETLGEQT